MTQETETKKNFTINKNTKCPPKPIIKRLIAETPPPFSLDK